MGKRKREDMEVDAASDDVELPVDGNKKKEKKKKKSSKDEDVVSVVQASADSSQQETEDVTESLSPKDGKDKKKKKKKKSKKSKRESPAEDEEPAADSLETVPDSVQESKTKSKKKKKRKKSKHGDEGGGEEEAMAVGDDSDEAAEPERKRKKKSKKDSKDHAGAEAEVTMAASTEAALEDTAWTSAEFDDDERKAKFLKLMGGEKAAPGKFLSLGGRKAHRPTLAERLSSAKASSSLLTLRADPVLDGKSKKASKSAVVTHLDLSKKAMGKAAQEKMSTELEEQFKTALHMKTQIKQGFGLGFSSKKFEIDTSTVRSKQFS